MNFLLAFFNTVLYQPLLNGLVLLYLYLPGNDFGISIIVLTILIRVIIFPLEAKAIKTQKALNELQPKIKEVQQKYKDDRVEQGRQTMALYKQAKINPFAGLLPLLIQLPLLISLFMVFRNSLTPETMGRLYSFVPNPGQIDPAFLGLVNLAEASGIVAILAGIAQFFQSKMIMAKRKKDAPENQKSSQFGQMMQKQMTYFFPIITVLIVWRLPSALGLYWITSALFSIGQQYAILKKSKLQITNDKSMTNVK